MLLYTPKNERTNWVYIMTNRRNGTLYTGSTSDIASRVTDHRSGHVKGFTSKYNLTRLVWFEVQDDMDAALSREKRIKNWPRQWKIDLIESMNPDWHDLYDEAKVSMSHVADY
jgi:putative endonuclease